MTRTVMRERLATYGERGRLVRVLREPYARAPKGARVRVQWTDPATGKLRTRSYPDASPASVKRARALGEELAVKLRGPDGTGPAPIALGDLWARYQAAKLGALRPVTRRNYAQQWQLAADVLGERTRADAVRAADLDRVKAAYRTPPAGRRALEHRTVREAVALLKRVLRWGVARELLARDRVSAWRYEIAKEERPGTPPEYSGGEYAAILAQLDPARRDQWRAWAALTVAGTQGARINAVLHLQWADVEGDAVTWRKAHDKVGREWAQPLRAATRAALAVARQYREVDGYAGPWVFYPSRAKAGREVYPYDLLHKALVGAERRAGVRHVRGRAAHSARRMVAGDLADATGDAFAAMHAIGDTDPRMAQRYVQRRDARVQAAFDQLDQHRPAAPAPAVQARAKRARKVKPQESADA